MAMHDTAIITLWVPVVVFAHVFAAFWFIKTYLLYDPRPLAVFRRRRSTSAGSKPPKARISEDGDVGSRDGGNEDVVLTLDKRNAAANALRRRKQNSVLL